jgi:hypothetical protein
MQAPGPNPCPALVTQALRLEGTTNPVCVVRLRQCCCQQLNLYIMSNLAVCDCGPLE